MLVGTLPWWRAVGEDGPESFKLGRRVMYRRTDVEKWLGDQRTGLFVRAPAHLATGSFSGRLSRSTPRY
jgi:hypothetical protein